MTEATPQQMEVIKTTSIDLNDLIKLAQELKADVLIDVECGSTSLNKDLIIACYPQIKTKENTIPLSFAVAGVMCRLDLWESPSNRVIKGVDALTKPISYHDGDCLANELNGKGFVTAIRFGGQFRVWGNRYALDYTANSGKNKENESSFIMVRRTANHISNSIKKAIFEVIDANITRDFISNVESKVNGYLYFLQSKGAISFGKCTLNKVDTTPEKIAMGQLYFDIEFTPTFPMEVVKFTLSITHEGIKDILK